MIDLLGYLSSLQRLAQQKDEFGKTFPLQAELGRGSLANQVQQTTNQQGQWQGGMDWERSQYSDAMQMLKDWMARHP